VQEVARFEEMSFPSKSVDHLVNIPWGSSTFMHTYRFFPKKPIWGQDHHPEISQFPEFSDLGDAIT